MFIVNVSIQVRPEAIAEFIAATRLNAQGARTEPGNLRFDVGCSTEDPTVFLLYEVYRTEQDFVAHQRTAHYLAWKAAVTPWMARPRVGTRFTSIVPDDAAWS